MILLIDFEVAEECSASLCCEIFASVYVMSPFLAELLSEAMDNQVLHVQWWCSFNVNLHECDAPS